MAQWINLNQNNSFVNRMRLPLLCKKSRATGRLAVRPNTGRFEILNSLPIILIGFSQSLMKERCYYRVTNVFRSVFRVRGML